MSRVERTAWKCDQCGYEWLPRGGATPDQCPSSRCRSRLWNVYSDDRGKSLKVFCSECDTYYVRAGLDHVCPKCGSPRWNLERRNQLKAHAAVAKALREGALVRKPCEVCGEVKSEAHHDDYDEPLQVRWLCRKHHALVKSPIKPALVAGEISDVSRVAKTVDAPGSDPGTVVGRPARRKAPKVSHNRREARTATVGSSPTPATKSGFCEHRQDPKFCRMGLCPARRGK